ncbi:MAG: nucleotidyl transferase, partial [Bryobacteraceae bacterium]
SFDWPALRGTAGAVCEALPQLGERFFVLYGDSYLPCDYAAVEREFLIGGKRGLMTVFRNEERWDRSNVEFAGGRILAYDKEQQTLRMRHIDYGLGAFHRSAFEGIAAGAPFELAGVYRRLLRTSELGAVEVNERFYEIGSLEGIAELSARLKEGSAPEELA